MKKQKQAAKTEESLSTAMAYDRISNLPIPILHRILCSLSQREASTEPYKDTVIKTSPYTNSISTYRTSTHDRSSPALNIKAFKLNFISCIPLYYDLPSAVFFSESLEELHLCKCRLSPVESVRFESLRMLTLEQVEVDGGTLETKTLGCPLLRRLVINNCWELRNIRLSEAPGLKHFDLCDCIEMEGGSIKIEVPNLETVRIRGPWIWSHCRSAFLFSRLASLHLCDVILSSESIDLLSFGCPTLESLALRSTDTDTVLEECPCFIGLALHNCFGFEEFHLASDSVKRLSIATRNILLKGVTICVPTTTSKGWDSNVILSLCEDDLDFNASSWFLMLRRILKPLSGSRIDLTLQMNSGSRLDVRCGAVDGSRLLSDEPPVVVENLEIRTSDCRTKSWYSDFTNDLFRVCRPRHVWGHRLTSKSVVAWNQRLSNFQFNILLANMSLGTFWRHDLEQVHVKAVDGEKFQLVEWTDLSELRKRTYDRVIFIQLKWRGQNWETGHMDGPFQFYFTESLGLL
ncbi:Unknown protein [Striga hermonthica]|uniref:F-box/LRR-repeat protein 15/At3g58940/PEG3-like LRR domain-containing protein n=1 Tax=Striga hermonthica TaxID=68872 RepID=A0A9N7RL42_STRHE|nr:Unknown protein [Striga hermonthica]